MATKTKTPLNTEGMTVYDKLRAVRAEFAEQEIKKSGKNLHAEFMYYELPDIVPPATEILTKYNALYLCNFPSGRAEGRFIDLDSKEEIVFGFDWKSIGDPAKFRMNEAQATGAELTYYRRYLYFLMLDITNKDEFDSKDSGGVQTAKVAKTGSVPTAPAAKPKGTSKPPTKEERKEITQSLTAPEGQADEMQIKALKAALSKLKDLDPTQEEFVQQIVVRTNLFTEITKEQCEALILNINEMLEAYNVGDN